MKNITRQKKQVNIILLTLLCLLVPLQVNAGPAAANTDFSGIRNCLPTHPEVRERLPCDWQSAHNQPLCSPPPVDSGLLWLVNPNHPLKPAYHPENLVYVNGYLIRPEAGSAFLNMYEDMKAKGITTLHLQSAYRPYQYQQVLFEDKVKALCGLGYKETEAKGLAAQTVAVPGASEHQTGLAVDVSVNGQLNVEFGDTEAGVWLHNNSSRYGYIVRYPRDKTEVTRIIYEPWHLRYVGVPHARYMQEHNLCLEEYIDHVKEVDALLYWVNEGSYYKVTYAAEIPGILGEAGFLDVSSIGPDEAMGYIITELKKFER